MTFNELYEYGIKSVMTFGGEPLLCPETVCEIHKAAKEMNVPKRQLITNGFFSKDYDKIKGYCWSYSSSNGYLVSEIPNSTKHVLLHRLVMDVEDNDIIVINKPKGMVVHPAPGHFTGTLVNALLHHCPDLSGIGGVARPGIVHRLDQDTSGLIVVAKTQKAMENLVKAFASHKHIEKTYLAVCHARPRLDAGRIENLIGRHPVDRKRMAIVQRNGKVAITNWKVLSSLAQSREKGYSLIECKIETGRTHQIRVHMASLGTPVIGDKQYGKSALDKRLACVPARQMLHAWKLSLWHPTQSRQMTFEASIPDDMIIY